MRTPFLETERLILRPIKEDDVDGIFSCWMQDEDVSRYMCWKATNDRDEAKDFVQYEINQINNDKWNRWLFEEKKSHELIGTGLIFYNEEEENWDISYNLGKMYWGNGFVTEAMTEILDYAKKDLGVKECIAIHAKENAASGNVIKKLGFLYEKDVPYECNGGEIHTVGKFYRLVL